MRRLGVGGPLTRAILMVGERSRRTVASEMHGVPRLARSNRHSKLRFYRAGQEAASARMWCRGSAMSEHRYCLRGEVDIIEAPRVRADLQAAIAGDRAHLVIDCSQLTFIDSSGVAALLETHRDLKAVGRHMLVVNVPEVPRRVFEVLGLSDLLRSSRSTVGGHGCRSF
jgi:anti-anti-sigma factor